MRRTQLLWLFLFPIALAAMLTVGCQKADATHQVSGAIEQIVSGRQSADGNDLWSDVLKFYEPRAFAPAWTDDRYPADGAAEALVALRLAREHGFSPEDYGEARILELHRAVNATDKKAPERVQMLAEFDTRVTASLLALGRDVALGRTDPAAIVSYWKARRESPDLAATLARVLDQRAVGSFLDEVRPPHPEYAALQKAYVNLLGQQEKGGWPRVPPGAFKRGASHAAVVALRQRLAAAGTLDADALNGSAVFDAAVETAVRGFQELHGIKATGTVDRLTLEAMNVPIEHRLEQVALNLERWRWMPNDLGARHIFVNIPYFHLVARENGQPVLDIRVVVGKPGNETPIFSDEMETVVFSPYWNIPDSIKQDETAPAAMRDPGYLDRNNIEVLRGSSRVDVSTIDWNDPAELRQLAFRQRPGATNALGHVKFMFPNEFDVYLHDTPADSLFERRGRAFSHGCVRVEEPEVLAQYVLRGLEEWDQPAIREAMHSGDERHVRLGEKIPVHLTYFTAWVDGNGGLHFQPDVYGYDQEQRTRKEQRTKNNGKAGVRPRASN